MGKERGNAIREGKWKEMSTARRQTSTFFFKLTFGNTLGFMRLIVKNFMAFWRYAKIKYFGNTSNVRNHIIMATREQKLITTFIAKDLGP